ncbi:DUF5988 family protein [Streptomyces klenkii]|uniref:DUF5988 family protein n=1 Tax=Streptomyces klenkii TaxID=1420899 RepID=UPI0033A96352
MWSDGLPDLDRVVVLRGGPRGLPRHYRLPLGHSGAESARLVVAYYGQHQHFERTGEMESTEGGRVPVFRWSYSTAIAE